ncbi:fcda1d19-401b-464c-ac91-009fe621fecd [Thermothielavioides terrestris]|uniref:Fcda1d19-401b-464c-ac91-009fe621fecd n=1 Tax=Thermothielavioides terrestris TaxID=2587410 RepID=A0A3S4D9P4_9PEZI|nr:fcda1d19-401b-464c-ac91-009fe621fecd [Thermothielavioides terrestris]
MASAGSQVPEDIRPRQRLIEISLRARQRLCDIGRMARSLREMMLLVDGVALESLAATVDGRHSVDEYFRDAVENLLEAHRGGWWLDWLFYMSVLSHLRNMHLR